MAGIATIKRTGYLHGGVTHPDGRRGFFKGAEQDSRDKGTSMSPGTDSGGGQRDQSDSGQRDDMNIRDFDTSVSNPGGKPNYKQTPPSKPKPTKDNTVKKNIFQKYFNYNPVVSTLNKISKNKFNTNQNAKRREKYLNNLLETNPNEYNRVMGQLSKVNMIVGPQGITSQVPPSMGFTQTDYGMPSAPPGMLTSNFEEIDGRKSLGDDAALEILGQKYKDTLPTFGGDDGGGDFGTTIIPNSYNVRDQFNDPNDEEEVGYDYRLGIGGDARDVTDPRGYYADGGIMGTRARRAFGGIMDRVTGRKAYGLGSIFKKVAKATKKVLKSPIGQAALIYAGGAYLGGSTMMGGAGGSFMSRMQSPSNLMNVFKNTKGRGIFDLGKKIGFNKLPEDASFFDKAMKFGKLGLLGYGLAKSPLGKVKPNEATFSDRGGQLIDPISGEPNDMAGMRENIELAKLEAGGDPEKLAAIDAKYNNMLNLAYQANLPDATPYVGFGKPGYRTTRAATGGRIGKAEGGLMDLGGMEKDYRNDGGFVPIGEYEKKDDVPARLSVNEFVFTADAVRSAGQGDIDKGAEVMENMMKNLENGGTVSEESQGNTGAQDMFSVSQRLGEVI